MNNKLQLTRRRFLSCLGGFALAPTLSGCDWLNLPIAIAAHGWVGYEPIFLARSEHWLDPTQVHLLETSSATQSLQALTEGKVDGAALTLDEMLTARATGLPLSVVMIFDTSAGADMLVVRPYIKELTDLKGQRLGFEQGAVGELMLAEVLKVADLTKQDIKLIPLRIDQHRNAWINNELDAVITFEPVASQLLAQDGIKLFDSRKIPNTIVDILAIRSDKLNYRHATALRHLLLTHFRTLDYLKRNPQDSAYRIATHLDLPAAEALKAYKGLVLPDAANNQLMLAGAAPELLTTAEKLSNIMVKNGLLKQNDPLTSLIDAEYLPTDFSTD